MRSLFLPESRTDSSNNGRVLMPADEGIGPSKPRSAVLNVAHVALPTSRSLSGITAREGTSRGSGWLNLGRSWGDGRKKHGHGDGRDWGVVLTRHGTTPPAPRRASASPLRRLCEPLQPPRAKAVLPWHGLFPRRRETRLVRWAPCRWLILGRPGDSRRFAPHGTNGCPRVGVRSRQRAGVGSMSALFCLINAGNPGWLAGA
jgi:hypothetical protein